MPRKKRLPAVIEKQDITDLGLTDKQAAFAMHFATGMSRTDAARAAGYAEATASAEAHRLLKNPLILQAIEQEVRMSFAEHAPMAVSVITELARSAKSGMVRLLAAQDLLDRAGHKPVEKQMHAVAGELVVKIDLG